MADYYYASITIPRRFIELDIKLASLIDRYLRNYDTDTNLWDLLEEGNEFNEIGECVLGIYDSNIINLSDSEARWGEFEEIETYCKQENIPYDRHTRGDMDADGNYTYWFRPGMKQAKYTLAPDEIAVFDICHIKKIIDSQPEDMSDTEVIQHLLDELYKDDFNSPINQLTNWA